jgi:hypothetical protein
MDTLYWWIGFIIVNLCWVFLAAVVLALLINGILVSISITAWELKIIKTNNLPPVSKWAILKALFRRIFENLFTDSGTKISSKYGTWNYLWRHVVWKIPTVTETV